MSAISMEFYGVKSRTSETLSSQATAADTVNYNLYITLQNYITFV